MIDALSNPIQPYAWGSRHAIPELLGVPPDGRPQAELWMGGHPHAPSQVDRGNGPLPLSELIEADPVGELGERDADRFGPRLPFLLKVLAVERPLSLQVHPTPVWARSGFASEEARGIPRDAPHRNYRDPHHKPELICALTPFDALCGFRPVEESAALFAALGEAGATGMRAYAADLDAALDGTYKVRKVLRSVMETILRIHPEVTARDLAQVRAAAGALRGGPFEEAAALVEDLTAAYPGDRGVLAALLLNRVRLEPGEGLFLPPGTPHAYLSGFGVEVMANSDNVLRCGLTPKHIDPPELLTVLCTEPAAPPILQPKPDPSGELVYDTPVPEFRLSRAELDGVTPLDLAGGGAQIFLCVEGKAVLTAHQRDSGEVTTLGLDQGQSAYVPARTSAVTATGSGTLFRATTGN